MELKYIHVSYDPEYIKTGETLNRGDVIGQTQTVKTVGRGNSRAHHLHFETWQDGKHFDPEIYFQAMGIEYDMKAGRKKNFVQRILNKVRVRNGKKQRE